jgi:predicted transcriptional regulator
MPQTTDAAVRYPGPLLDHATAIVAAYARNNPIAVADLSAMIKSVHAALAGLANGSGELATSHKPAVPIKRSITPGYIVCLEDGKKLKMLKRYIRTRFQLSPDAYRSKWGLPRDYPMVAPDYAQLRSQFAKKIGLGKTRPPVKKRKRG